MRLHLLTHGGVVQELSHGGAPCTMLMHEHQGSCLRDLGVHLGKRHLQELVDHLRHEVFRGVLAMKMGVGALLGGPLPGGTRMLPLPRALCRSLLGSEGSAGAMVLGCLALSLGLLGPSLLLPTLLSRDLVRLVALMGLVRLMPGDPGLRL